MAKSDFDVVASLFEDFFKKPEVTEALDAISEDSVTGWEKWWQIQMFLFLKHSEIVAEWDMEHLFAVDGRTVVANEQTTMQVDLAFRLKNYLKDTWFFVELKQNQSWKSCLTAMAKDVEKIYSAKKYSAGGITMRNCYFAGVFYQNEKVTVGTISEVMKDAYGYTIKCITSNISNEFQFILFEVM